MIVSEVDARKPSFSKLSALSGMLNNRGAEAQQVLQGTRLPRP